MDEKKDQGNKKDQEVKKPVKNAVDLQKLKLDKLFKNIERPVHLPEPLKKRGFSSAPEFVRNVMGSSAGAGSGEFHVYRHIRRRENARLKYIAEEAVKDDKDEAYQKKLEENWTQSEQRTAKKRAKRLKRKAARHQAGREKRPKVAAPATGPDDDGGSESDSDGDDSESEPAQQGAAETEVTATRPGPAEGGRVPAAAAGQRGGTAGQSDPLDRQGTRPESGAGAATDRGDAAAAPGAVPETDRGAADVSTESAEAGPHPPRSGERSAAEAE